MALPTFATLTNPQPLAVFDTQFALVAALGAVPCSASGTNTIALTPLANTPTISSYPDLQPSFVFAAQASSTGAVTINVNAVGPRNAYKWNGLVALGSGDIINGLIYRATPLLALNAGAGGFVVDTVGGLSATQTDLEFIISGGGSAITTGQKGFIRIPYPLIINNWTVMGDQSGSISVDILRAANAVPTVSIVGAGNAPGLTAAQYSGVVNPSAWTSVNLNTNDWIGFNVLSAATVTSVTVDLRVAKQ